MPAGLGTVVVLGGLGWLLLSIFGSDDAGGGEVPGGGGSGGGTGGGGAGGGDVPGAPAKPKAPPSPAVPPPADVPINPVDLRGGGWWGDPSKIPADFNWDGNGWFVSGDCSAVAIGRGFAPENFTLLGPVKRQTITTLQSVTQIVPGPVAETGTLWNYLFHIAFDLSIGVPPGGGVLPEAAAENVREQLSPFCASMDSWPPLFKEAVLEACTTFYMDQIEPAEGM